jgi:hypothetical protein
MPGAHDAFSGRDIDQEEWLLAPPQAGDFKLLVAIGNTTSLPEQVASAIDELIAVLEEHDFLVAEGYGPTAKCPLFGHGPACPGRNLCPTRCGGFCDSKCQVHCNVRSRAVAEGLLETPSRPSGDDEDRGGDNLAGPN